MEWLKVIFQGMLNLGDFFNYHILAQVLIGMAVVTVLIRVMVYPELDWRRVAVAAFAVSASGAVGFNLPMWAFHRRLVIFLLIGVGIMWWVTRETLGTILHLRPQLLQKITAKICVTTIFIWLIVGCLGRVLFGSR